MRRWPPAGTDWKEVLLVAGLWLIVFLTLDHVIDWAADRWRLGMLQIRYKQSDTGTALALVISVVTASRIADALRVRPSRQPGKLDSKPPLP